MNQTTPPRAARKKTTPTGGSAANPRHSKNQNPAQNPARPADFSRQVFPKQSPPLKSSKKSHKSPYFPAIFITFQKRKPIEIFHCSQPSAPIISSSYGCSAWYVI